ncbi:Asp23/Gls24 family envelope stress response protein [Rubeoparvulum massiliense]|uniref:Asp23/Gls24 family envelope stress response protein n=1 Tax=Rubeoparvulum massiliense TaxID=1631346 RepID=UPI00065DEA16|nr:Asp23/Gls24 family envelope stress response protein [Rubeoparvulum massiliense]
METELPANFTTSQIGTISISTEVFELIARLVAEEVPGIVQMSSGFMGELAERFGRKGRGVRVEVENNQVSVEISVVVQYGFAIPVVARDLQLRVRQAIVSMTGMDVQKVDVYVDGIDVKDELQPQKQPAGIRVK